jgi:ribose transport system permease protein
MMLYLTKIKKEIIEQATVILFVLIVLVFSLLSPQFFTFANLVNILIQASSLAIVASGITLVLLTAGIDLSVGSIMFVAGVISGKLAVTGSPVWLVALLVMMTGFVFGLLNALFIGRFKVVPFIATLATLYIGRGFGLYLSDTRAINLPDAFLQIGSARILGIPFPIVVMVLVVGIVHLLLSRSVWGRQIYAVGHSKEKAVKAGLPVEKLLLSVYLISGLCAAIGGLVAMAQLGAVSPTFGWQTEFTAIAAAVLGGTSLFGGRGNVFPGTVIGAVTIQALQSGLVIVNADPYFYPLITGAVIFLIVLIDSIRNREQLKRRRRVA